MLDCPQSPWPPVHRSKLGGYGWLSTCSGPARHLGPRMQRPLPGTGDGFPPDRYTLWMVHESRGDVFAVVGLIERVGLHVVAVQFDSLASTQTLYFEAPAARELALHLGEQVLAAADECDTLNRSIPAAQKDPS